VDPSTAYPPLVNTTAIPTEAHPPRNSQPSSTTHEPHSTNSLGPPSQLSTTTTTVDYAAELAALKNDLQSLRTLITTAVEQLKRESSSLHATPATNEMETDGDKSMTTTPDLPDLIADLKHDIATTTIKM